MDMDHDLDEFKGDVDFDFFDEDSSKQKSPSPKPKRSEEKVDFSRPEPARKSPTPDLTKNNRVSDDSSTKHSPVNGNYNRQDEKWLKHDESPSQGSDCYSSDSDHTDSVSESESDPSSFSDVSSVRSGTRARNRRRSVTDSGSSSPTHETTAPREQRSRSTSREKKGRRSRSESISSSESESDTASDTDSDRTPSPTPRKNRRNVKFEKQSEHRKKTPVRGEDRKTVSSKMRPGSAHPRRRENGVHVEAWGNERNERHKSNSHKKHSDRHKRDDYDKDDRSLSGSDSDMTDVSPLNSPRNSPTKGKKDSKTSVRDEISNSSHRKTVQYCAMPDNEYDQYRVTHGQHETLDLNILMKAVSELEKKKRVKENTRRVMFAPPKKNERGNYTFNDDRTRVIERENQRLLHEIMKHVAEQREPHRVRRPEPAPIRRPTASAINRQRQHKKIEQENLTLLRRLQNIRPTRGMARDDQINEYHRTVLHGVPMATAEEIRKTKTRRSRPGSAGSSISQRSRSMSSVHSASTITSAASTVRSRPGSAKKFRPIDTRPEWSDRW